MIFIIDNQVINPNNSAPNSAWRNSYIMFASNLKIDAMENNSSETVLFSLPLARLEPIFKGWVKEVLLEHNPQSDNTTTTKVRDCDPWMSLSELIAYHPDHPHPQTVYRWIREYAIPVNKTSRRLRFRTSEIDAWLKSGHKKTYEELKAEVSSNKTSR